MTVFRFLAVLWGRRWLGLGVLAAVLALTALGLARTPERFTATAVLLLDLRPNDPLAPANGALLTAGYMSTQIDLLTSERVVLGALKRLSDADAPTATNRAAWLKDTAGQGDIDAWRAARVRERIDIRPTRDSGVVTVQVSDSDRHAAARMANALVAAYSDTALALRVEPARAYAASFDARAAQLRADLEAAQARLSAAQRNSGVLAATDQRLDLESARLMELSSQVSVLQAVAAESASRAQQSLGQGDRLTEVVTNPLLVALNTQLAQQQARWDELASRLGDAHPQVREAQAATTQLRSRIVAESARVASSVGLGDSVNQSRLAQARQALASQRDKVLQLKTQGDSLAVLQRDVQAAQRNHEAVLAQAARAALESQATQTNITVLRQATPAAQRAAPKSGLVLAMAAVVGCVLAIGVVLAAEVLDTRLRLPADVHDTLRLPMLVVLPALPTARLWPGGRWMPARRRAVS